jgi:ribosomal protein L11 methyltransferase
VQEEEDWSENWKHHFRPVRISDRLVVAAPWHNVPDALVIEPGNAFGTGEHPTTRACLRAVDRHARPGATLLDVGCGSGVLALAGAKLGMRARGIDIDPDAIAAAREAAVANHLDVQFDTTPLAEVEGRWDLVVANVYAEVLVAMAPDLLRLAAGPIALAGILAERAHLVRAAFASRPCVLDEEEEGWVSLEFGA